MICIFHEVRRNNRFVATNYGENIDHFSRHKIIRLVQNIFGLTERVLNFYDFTKILCP